MWTHCQLAIIIITASYITCTNDCQFSRLYFSAIKSLEHKIHTQPLTHTTHTHTTQSRDRSQCMQLGERTVGAGYETGQGSLLPCLFGVGLCSCITVCAESSVFKKKQNKRGNHLHTFLYDQMGVVLKGCGFSWGVIVGVALWALRPFQKVGAYYVICKCCIN